MAETKISVRSDLLKIAEDLKTIAQTADNTASSLEEATKNVGKEVDNQMSLVGAGMDKIRKMGKNVARQLGSDFKSLFSVNALAGGMKLSEQFGNSIKQAVTLNDTIRNLSPIFGMNEAAANRFKSTLVKNLSAIGIGSDAAANALQGLAETNVRGDKNLSDYAKTASQLASISKQKGQEGNIAKGMAGVVVSQGGNPNDPSAMRKVAEDIVRIRNATGKSATEALDTLNKLFSSANTDFKKKLLQGGGVSLAAAGLLGGQGSTAFLERYMGLSKQGRAGYEAQGLGRLIGQDGQLNNGAFQSTVGEAKRRGSGNAEFGLQTMGMSEEEAKGFLRLADAMNSNGAAVERARLSTVNLNDEFKKTITLGDAFKANLNQVKGGLSSFMDKVAPNALSKLTDTLQEASQTGAGATAVVGGSAILAAMLTGGGLRGIGGGLLQSKAIEGVTGEKSQNVFVTNWPSTFGVAGAGGAAATAAKAAGGIGAMGGAAVAATTMMATAAAFSIYKGFSNTKEESAEELKGMGAVQDERGNYISNMMSREDAAALKAGGVQPEQSQEQIAESIDRLIEVMANKGHGTKDVNVTVKSKDKSLIAFPSGSRGAAQ